MKKSFKTLLLLMVLIICLIFIYSMAVVIKARTDTPGIMAKALNAQNITLNVNDLSQWQLRALLAVEDPGFYHHKGIDFKTPGAGITTITQGLVKLYYFSHFKPGLAKLKQTLIARFALDPLVSKNDQLKLFINNVYLGNYGGEAVIGFANAAKIYYHKSFRRLTKDEYVSILAMIIAPNNFHILNRPAANGGRVRRIKRVISGEYRPKGLMDVYYGKLDRETQKGLPPASYFPSLYRDK